MKVKCEECISDLTFMEPIASAELGTTLIDVKDRGGLVRPPQVVLLLCQAAESSLRLVLQAEGLTSRAPRLVTNHTASYALSKNLQDRFNCTIHAASLISELIQRYIKIRMHYEAKKATSAPVLRSKLNRLIIFSHV